MTDSDEPRRDAPAQSFQAGWATEDITPQEDYQLGGGAFGQSHGVLHPLQAQAIAVRFQETTCVLLGADCLGFGAAWSRELRAQIAEDLDLSPEAILLTATHTHNAPASVDLRNWGTTDPGYMDFLAGALRSLARRAMDALAPAELFLADDVLPGATANRCIPEPPSDQDRILLLHFRSLQDQSSALIVNFACHPVNLHSSGLVTPDFPHFLRARMGEKLGNVSTLFLQGASGDLLPARYEKQPDESAARALGESLADKAAEMLQSACPVGPGGIDCMERAVEVPLVPLPDDDQLRQMIQEHTPKLAAWPEPDMASWDYTRHKTAIEWAREAIDARAAGNDRTSTSLFLQAISIGQLLILGVPNELFDTLGARIRRALTPRCVLIATLSSGCEGYLATAAAHEKESYEASKAFRYIGLQCLAPTTGEFVVEQAISLLQDLARR